MAAGTVSHFLSLPQVGMLLRGSVAPSREHQRPGLAPLPMTMLSSCIPSYTLHGDKRSHWPSSPLSLTICRTSRTAQSTLLMVPTQTGLILSVLMLVLPFPSRFFSKPYRLAFEHV